MAVGCRFCGTELVHRVVDLGTSPLCQSQVEPGAEAQPDAFHPLCASVCHACFLVQLEQSVPPAVIFGRGDYAYFSSYSDSWLEHARRSCEALSARFGLGSHSRVVEVASNDGYPLQYFHEKGIPVLGVEPAANCAAAAREKGIDCVVAFFGRETAQELRAEHGCADLLIANNVLAHVPELNDFVAGLRLLLAPEGALSLEFPHLLRLLQEKQFDTIYHEHYSYFSLATAEQVLAQHGLEVFDVEELPTHGGSLRLLAGHPGVAGRGVDPRVHALRAREQAAGLRELGTYAAFEEEVRECKRALLDFLIRARRAGRQVVGYGAAGKGNTLLNYCGIRRDFLDYTVDRSPHKQGRLLPGTRIPVHAPEKIFETRPDYVLILPWNLRDEIMEQMSGIREWGGRFVVPIPRVSVHPPESAP